MKQNKLMFALGLVVLLSMVMAACQPVVQTVEVKVVETQIVAGTSVVKEVTKVVVVTPTAVPATAVPPTAAPKASDTAVVVLQQEPDTLHPGVGSMMARTIALAPIFVGCMGQNEKAVWIPLGCESVPTIDNGGAKWVGEGADKHLEVTYKIRKDWRWTDGTKVTTKDVLAWWKLNMDPEFEVASRVGYEKIYDLRSLMTIPWLWSG